MPEQNTAGYELVLGSGRSPQGPVEVLQRKIRSDQGQPPAFGPKLVEVFTAQYREHPHWNDQLHADHLVVLLKKHSRNWEVFRPMSRCDVSAGYILSNPNWGLRL